MSVGRSLTKLAIRDFLKKPTWSITSLLRNPAGVEAPKIDDVVVKKMLRISGLESTVSQEETAKIKKALETQMVFVNHLYDQGNINDSTNNDHFRLLPGDHRQQEPLTLQQIEKSISGLKPSADKGETGNFTARNLQNSPFFVIKARQ